MVGLGRPVCLEPDLPKRAIADSSTVSKLGDVRTGIKLLDSAAELWWSGIQLQRLGAGKQPRKHLTGWEAVGHALVRDGLNAVRRKRS
jgi:hypothetical protein